MLITVDSGRHGVKTICNGERLFFPAVTAPGHDFKMDIDTAKPGYYYINYLGNDYFIGDLAIKQSEYGMEDRTRDKANSNNKLLILNAVSMFADVNDHVTLLTNVPARDWMAQKDRIAESLRGVYRIHHKAGIRQGMMVQFTIDKVFALPEGAGAFYGYVFDDGSLEVNPGREDYLDGQVLVLEIGDETVNYIVMEDGEYVDNSCGSLDLGLRIAHAEILRWLEDNGIETNNAKLVHHIRNNKNFYCGSREYNVRIKAYEEYDKLATIVYSRLNSRIRFNQFRRILLAGGGCFELYGGLKKLLPYAPDCPLDGDGQWLNARGFEIMYKMMQEQ